MHYLIMEFGYDCVLNNIAKESRKFAIKNYVTLA